MRISLRLLRSTAAAALAFAAPATMRAQDSAPVDTAFPARIVDRPGALPRGYGRIDAFAVLARQPGTPRTWTAVLGGGIGLGRNLEAGGQLVPVRLSPDVALATPSVYLTWAPDGGALAFQPTLQAVVPAAEGEAWTVDAGVTVTRTLGSWGTLAFAPTFSLTPDGGAAGTTLTLPLTLTAQASDRLAVEISSGAGLSRVEPRFGLSRRGDPLDWNDLTVPASATLVHTLVRGRPRRPLADLSVQWQWPALWTRSPDGSGWQADDWAIQLQSSWYIAR